MGNDQTTQLHACDAGETVRTVHVDTSLIIEQQKASKQAEPVRIRLADNGFRSTSTYAKKEFKRAWLQDLALLYKMTRDEDCEGIGHLLEKIEKSLWKPEAKRRRSRCVTAVVAFLSKQKAEAPIGVLLTRFRTHVVEAIFGGFLAFDRTVTHAFDGTSCVRAREKPLRAGDGSIDVRVRRCQRKSIQCTVHTFFDSHRKSFQSIKNAIDAEGEKASRELRETAKTITEAERDSECLCDDSGCSSMSDALIAMDGINMQDFAANNPREWTVIASALGKPLINPVVESGS